MAVLLSLLAVLGVAMPAAAQSPGITAGDETAPYEVGEGDILRIDVVGRRDMSGSYTVGPDGSILIPVVGSVQVEGRTVEQIRSDLSRRISLFDRTNPQVTIGVAEYRSRKIFVLGAVLLPGIYAFADMPNAWDAIAEAGGPLEDADLTKVEVIPGDTTGGRTTETVDVAAAIRESRANQLPRLRPGDTIRIPRGAVSTTVLLMGAVVRPGPVPVDQAHDLVSAIARAGGPTTDAKLSQIDIVRGRSANHTKLRVNLKAYFDGADVTGNPALESGDTVFVPRSSRGITGFIGAVGGAVGLVSSIVLLITR